MQLRGPRLADGTPQRIDGGLRHVADGAQAQPRQPFFRRLPDAPQGADGQRVQERERLLVRNDEQPVGLRPRGGEFRDELGRCGTDGGDQAGFLSDAFAQHPPDVPGRTEQGARAAHVEKRLVDAERLDERRHVAKDRHDAL